MTNAEEFIAHLEADGIEVTVRRGPSGDLLGYAVGRPGDVNVHTVTGPEGSAPGALLAALVWPALATVLADAETRGHQPHHLLKEAAAQRELTISSQRRRHTPNGSTVIVGRHRGLHVPS